MKKIVLGLLLGMLAIGANAQEPTDSISPEVRDSLFWERWLDEATIVAVKPLVKLEADQLSYDVSNDPDSKAATVLDILRKVPMVMVDGQDNITVNGSGSFKIYVDGKPSPMFATNPSQIFKMMPASMVEKIEVVTNPGAKYDAEGAVGVLNIKLAKMGGGGATSVNGTTGTVRAEVGNRGFGEGISFSSQQGKLSLSGNIMNNYQRLKGIEHTTTNTSLADNSTLTQTAKTGQRMHFSMANLNLGYDLDSLNTFSASVNVNGFQVKANYHPEVFGRGGIYGDGYAYDYNASTKLKNISLDASADWQHFLSADRESFLTLSYMLSYSPGENETSQEYDPTMSLPSMFNHNDPKSLEQTLQFDFTKQVAMGQKLSLGAKYINRNNNSLSKYYSLDGGVKTLIDDNTVDFKHTNNIGAAYAEYEAEFGIVGAKAGLRYEHTWQEVDYRKGGGADFSTDYGNLVPSLSLNIRPGMTKNIGLTYNMRISRPGISYLNPYVDKMNPLNIQYGNPDLEVEKNHNIGLSFGSYSQTLMYQLRLQQRFCNDRISEYSFYKDDVLNTTYGNVVKERQSSANLFVNWLALPKTRLMINGEVSYVDLRSDVLGQSNNGWHNMLMMGIQQTLPWDLKLGANVMMGSKNYKLQGWDSGFKIGFFTLSKSLLNDRLNLSARFITGLSKKGHLKIENYTEGADFKNKLTINVPITQFTISVSYTFGNTKVKVKEHSSRIENDFSEKKSEQEQIGNSTSGGM